MNTVHIDGYISPANIYFDAIDWPKMHDIDFLGANIHVFIIDQYLRSFDGFVGQMLTHNVLDEFQE
jgi:hypothetical protein